MLLFDSVFQVISFFMIILQYFTYVVNIIFLFNIKNVIFHNNIENLRIDFQYYYESLIIDFAIFIETVVIFIKEIKKKYDKLFSEIQDINKQLLFIKDLLKDYNNIKQDNEKLKQDNEKLKQDNELYQIVISNIHKNNINLELSNELICMKYHELLKDYNNIKQDNELYQIVISNIHKNNINLELSNELICMKYHESKEKESYFYSIIDEYETTIIELCNENKKQEIIICDLHDENDNLQEIEYNKLVDKYNELIDELKEKHDIEYDKLVDGYNELIDEIDILKEKNDELTETINNCQMYNII